MKKAGAAISGDPTPVGNCGGMIRFEFFNDGLTDDNDVEVQGYEKYFSMLEDYGKKSLIPIFNRLSEEGRPVSYLINNPFVPWVTDMAEELKIPSAMLWVQSCACFSLFYHYENSSVPFPSLEQPDIDVHVPNMPVLKSDEIQTFLHPSSPYGYVARYILRQFRSLSKMYCVLMETYEELEDELIKNMSQVCQIRTVGPLFKNPLLKTTANITGDLIKADDCLEWLDSKDPSSVVYISFGSQVIVKQEQLTEMAYGVLNSGVSFLWVIRSRLPEEFLEAVGRRGMVVNWSPQDQVLSHPAVSCFVTHCGWNSTLEALSSGVPVVTFPQWGDQVTNAKYLVDEWKVGIRMCRGEAENKVIGRKEVEECLREATCGVNAAKMKENALKWKKAAELAVAEGGTSDRSLKEFVDDIRTLGG
ncbi:hypothetical protein L2E82_01995 [Cichorium intybus]|uniref:Uncharacterized protein n=1 Tax=Cichorium intybus TaxID=13427 RepID=A0ACB9H1I5_CICIN|nr:hypothetical protein L2E82_01995 [Cichorium intybus]